MEKLEGTALHSEAVKLIQGASVEVGYRSTCGTTHSTLKNFRVFKAFIKALRAQKIEVSETPVSNKNAYATINGGFWNSYIFEIQK